MVKSGGLPRFTNIWPTGTTHVGTSTFGAPLSLQDDHDLDVEMADALDAAKHLLGKIPSNAELEHRLKRDRTLGLLSRRWMENDDGLLVTKSDQIYPGDIPPLRSTLLTQLAQLTTLGDHQTPKSRVERAARTARLLYSAVPYWLPRGSAWGFMAMRHLTDDDLDALRLSAPTLIVFSHPMEIPDEDLELDPTLLDRLNLVADVDEPDLPACLDSLPPDQVRGGTMELLRRYRDLVRNRGEPVGLFRYQLIGAVLTPRSDGSLGDTVLWLLRKINPKPSVATHDVVAGGGLTVSSSSGVFSVVEGRLSVSLLGTIGASLAAAVAWAGWDSPPSARGDDLPTDRRELRKLAKTSAFRKSEKRGAFAGVHVLTVQDTVAVDRRVDRPAATNRRTATHWRVGLWQRYRVGSRDNWHYERRHKPPRIINAGLDPLEDLVRVYRLPTRSQ